jgi:phosphoglycolate phosphatase
LYEGVRELLTELAHDQRWLAVATGKPRAGLERAFQYTKLKPHFRASRCGDEGRPKPHPDMLQHLLGELGVDASRALMIGDTTHDLNLAANAGITALAVTYGAHPREALARHSPIGIVDSVVELHAWLWEHA